MRAKSRSAFSVDPSLASANPRAKYPKYKPSGVEWLGEVPEHWDVKRLKFLLQEPLQYGANEAAELDDPDLPRFVRITDVDEQGNLREETFRSIPEEVAKPYLLQEDDLLFARSGATVGKTFFYQKTWGRAAYAGYLIRARLNRKDVFPKFVNQITKTGFYQQWIQSMLIQATIQNVNAEKYASFVIPLPPLPEQQAIAAFLDRETSRIDTLIGKKQKLVELLAEQRMALISRAVTKGLDAGVKMKPSGVEWLGEVPEHWGVKPLKYLFKNMDNMRIPLSGEERSGIEKIYPYYGASGIIDFVDDFIYDETLILVAEDGANLLSRSTPLAFRAEGKYWVNNHAHILRPKFNVIRYWESVLQVFDFTPYVSGSAQPKLTSDNLGSLLLPLPPLLEQQAIAAFLDRETARIDALVAKVESAIDRLKEYRTALISAAVTGKIDVRGIRG
jgi:type I restriction enzyme S subunit